VTLTTMAVSDGAWAFTMGTCRRRDGPSVIRLDEHDPGRDSERPLASRAPMVGEETGA
jgi:hypothetical protein